MARALDRLSLINSRDQVKSDCTGPPVPGQSWPPAVSLAFCASGGPNGGNPFEFAWGANDDPHFSSSRSSFGTPRGADFLPSALVPARFQAHRCSGLASHRSNDSSVRLGRPASPSDRAQPSSFLPAGGALPRSALFFDNLFEDCRCQAQIRIPLLQATVLCFPFLQAFQCTD